MGAESIREAVQRVVQGLLRQAHAVQSILHCMEYVWHQATVVVEQLPAPATLACAPRCAFCCYHPVDITPPEAFVIAAHVQTALAPAVSEAVCARLAAQARRLSGLSYEAHARARLPCALLVDGQCAVYPCRPLACRAWHSTSVARCEAIFRHGNPVTMIPPLDMGLYEAVWDIAHGMKNGLQRRRLDSKSYELHSILQRVFDTPEAASRWLQGEEVFAGCTVGALSV